MFRRKASDAGNVHARASGGPVTRPWGITGGRRSKKQTGIRQKPLERRVDAAMCLCNPILEIWRNVRRAEGRERCRMAGRKNVHRIAAQCPCSGHVDPVAHGRKTSANVVRESIGGYGWMLDGARTPRILRPACADETKCELRSRGTAPTIGDGAALQGRPGRALANSGHIPFPAWRRGTPAGTSCPNSPFQTVIRESRLRHCAHGFFPGPESLQPSTGGPR
jgi:hypothetical protein